MPKVCEWKTEVITLFFIFSVGKIKHLCVQCKQKSEQPNHKFFDFSIDNSRSLITKIIYLNNRMHKKVD